MALTDDEKRFVRKWLCGLTQENERVGKLIHTVNTNKDIQRRYLYGPYTGAALWVDMRDRLAGFIGPELRHQVDRDCRDYIIELTGIPLDETTAYRGFETVRVRQVGGPLTLMALRASLIHEFEQADVEP